MIGINGHLAGRFLLIAVLTVTGESRVQKLADTVSTFQAGINAPNKSTPIILTSIFKR